MLIAVMTAVVWSCAALFAGAFRSFVPVTLTSDRSGLVMESGAKVKMRGVVVGRVAGIEGGHEQARLKLQIFPEDAKRIPENVEAEIQATTAFGAKFVELIPPSNPSAQRLAAGTVLHSRNVSIEVNTVFENLVSLLHQIDPAKLNAVLSAVGEAVRGKGERIGEATTDANQVLFAVNPRMGTVRADWHSLKGFSDPYAGAAHDILATLNAASTTATTITDEHQDLDALLLNVIGFSNTATNLLAPNENNLVQAINGLEPTTNLLLKYNPEYTCTLQGAKSFLDNGGRATLGGNG